MKTQKDKNPFEHSDSNKRYYTYDHYMKERFGRKCFKVPLDAGFTCPNIDGTKGRGGCIYCRLGSRSNISDESLSPREQYLKETELFRKKDSECLFVPYFQSFSCTYAKTDQLKALYDDALTYENAVGISIGTRADCIDEENAVYLAELAEKTLLTVELGLQTSSDKTAELINRCHSFDEFIKGYMLLRKASKKIRVGVHIIIGLPGETEDDVMKTARDAAFLSPDEVKIHLLHILKGTALYEMYLKGAYTPWNKDDYVSAVCKVLEVLPPDTVIGRLTGDGDHAFLAAPLYSKDKKSILNAIDKRLYETGSYQGRLYRTERREK